MAFITKAFTLRGSSPALRGLVNRVLVRQNQHDGRGSAKDAFKKMFQRTSSAGGRHPKPKYDMNSYGQSTGADYPFDVEKTAESKLKRDKIKDAFGSVSVEEVLTILNGCGAVDVKMMELPGEMNYAEQFVVASGKSTEHIKEMTEKVRKELKATHGHDVHVEGLETFDWMAIDAGNVIVHLFLPQVREEYHIEETWNM